MLKYETYKRLGVKIKNKRKRGKKGEEGNYFLSAGLASLRKQRTPFYNKNKIKYLPLPKKGKGKGEKARGPGF